MIRVFIASLLYLIGFFTQTHESPQKDLGGDSVSTHVSAQASTIPVGVYLVDDFYPGRKPIDINEYYILNLNRQYIHKKRDMVFYSHPLRTMNQVSNSYRFEPIKFEVIDKDLTFEIGI